MSDEPLTPKNTVIVVACADYKQANDELAKYGEQVVAKVLMYLCKTQTDVEVSIATLPPSTPWTIMQNSSPYVVESLQRYFGTPRNFSYAIEAQNNEYAISPRKLQL